jgi:hypothetical protein
MGADSDHLADRVQLHHEPVTAERLHRQQVPSLSIEVPPLAQGVPVLRQAGDRNVSRAPPQLGGKAGRAAPLFADGLGQVAVRLSREIR